MNDPGGCCEDRTPASLGRDAGSTLQPNGSERGPAPSRSRSERMTPCPQRAVSPVPVRDGSRPVAAGEARASAPTETVRDSGYRGGVLTATLRARAGGHVLWPRDTGRPRPPLRPGRNALPPLPTSHPPDPVYEGSATEPAPPLDLTTPLTVLGRGRAALELARESCVAGGPRLRRVPLDGVHRRAPSSGITTFDSGDSWYTFLIPTLSRWGRGRVIDEVRLVSYFNRNFIVVGYDAAGLDGTFDPIDRLVMQYMRDNGLPNGSLALANGQGQLVYAKGFTDHTWYGATQPTPSAFGGPSDAEPYRGFDNITTPQTLFRWASVTKPVTATCVMKAVEDGLLSLTDRVFGDPRWRARFVNRNTTAAQHAFLNDLTPITIQNLLQHTSGWSGGRSSTWPCRAGSNPKSVPRRIVDYLREGDGAGLDEPRRVQSLPLPWRDWPRLMMDTQIPDTVGSQLARHRENVTRRLGLYCYDNFNYGLLAVILEEVYNKAVDLVWDDLVFDALDMPHSSLTGRTLDERKRGEVLYFGTREHRTARTRSNPGDDPGWSRDGENQIALFPERVATGYGGDRDYEITAGADGLRSNVVDMVRFALSLRLPASILGAGCRGVAGTRYPRGVVSGRTLAQMWGQSSVGLQGGNYGLGLKVRSGPCSPGQVASRGPYAAWHGGAAPGIHSMIHAQADLGPEPRMYGSAFAVVFNRYAGYNNGGGPVSSARFGDTLLAYLNSGPGTRDPGRQAVLDALSATSTDLFTRYR